MNGPEHYREAERLLREVNREQAPNFEGTIRPVHHDGLRAEMVAQAQVHATLAHAAAVIDAGNAVTWTSSSDGDWHEVENSGHWKEATS